MSESLVQRLNVLAEVSFSFLRKSECFEPSFFSLLLHLPSSLFCLFEQSSPQLFVSVGDSPCEERRFTTVVVIIVIIIVVASAVAA